MKIGAIVVSAIAATAVALAFGSSGASAKPPTDVPTGGPMSAKQRLYAQLRAIAELTEDQRLFLMLVAHGESNYHASAFNKSAGEAAAAGKAYDRIAAELGACGRPRAEYVRGSGGRFGRLVPYYVHDLRNVVHCIDPATIGDGLHDIVSAIANAHALQGYASWNGLVSGLRGGWGTIAWLDAPPPDKVAKWRRHATEAHLMGAGVDGGAFLDRPLADFPGPSQLPTILGELMALRAAGGP